MLSTGSNTIVPFSTDCPSKETVPEILYSPGSDVPQPHRNTTAMSGSSFISVLVCNSHESLDERKAEFPLAASKRASIISGRLAPGPAAEGLVNAGINAVGNKAHRAIAEQAI